VTPSLIANGDFLSDAQLWRRRLAEGFGRLPAGTRPDELCCPASRDSQEAFAHARRFPLVASARSAFLAVTGIDRVGGGAVERVHGYELPGAESGLVAVNKLKFKQD